MAQCILVKQYIFISPHTHQDGHYDRAQEGTVCTPADDVLQCEDILVKCPGADWQVAILKSTCRQLHRHPRVAEAEAGRKASEHVLDSYHHQ